MLEEVELTDMAASIKAEGLHDPIVWDTEGTLLDGRKQRSTASVRRRAGPDVGSMSSSPIGNICRP